MAVTFPNDVIERAGATPRALSRGGLARRHRGILHRRLIAACLTEVAGSSDVVDRGFVTYANEAKRDLLGVPG